MRLPQVIGQATPRAERPSMAAIQVGDLGLTAVARDVREWDQERQRTQILEEEVQRREDDKAAEPLVNEAIGRFQTGFAERGVQWDGRTPGFAKGELSQLDSEFRPLLDREDLSPGVREAVRRRYDQARSQVGQQAIDYEARRAGARALEVRQAVDGAALSQALVGFNTAFGQSYKGRIDGFTGAEGGFASGVLDDFDRAAEAAIAAAPPHLRDTLQQRLDARKIEVHASALDVETRGQSAFVVQQATQSGQGLVNAIYSNPALFDSLGSDADVVVQSLPPALRSEARNRIMGEGVAARIDALVREGQIDQAQRELEDGRYDAYISPDQKRVLLNRATESRDRLSLDDYVRRQEVGALVDSDVASIMTSGEGVTGLTPEGVAEALGPAAAAQWLAQRDQARDVFAATEGFKGMSEQEIQERLRSLEPQPGDPEFAQKAQAYEAARRVSERQIEMRREDAATWAMSAAGGVQQRFQAYTQTNAPADRRRAAADYANASLRAQSAADLPLSARRILPKEFASGLVARYENAAPEQRHTVLTEIGALIEDFSTPTSATEVERRGASGRGRMIVSELRRAGLDAADVAAAVDFADRPALLARYVASKRESAFAQRMSPTERNALNDALESELGPYLRSFDPLPGASDMAAGRVGVARSIALKAMAEGRSPGEAARDAARVMTDGYVFVGSQRWRMPLAVADGRPLGDEPTRYGVNPKGRVVVEQGTRNLMRSLLANEGANLYAPQNGGANDAERRELYADFVANNGRWVTTGDDGGLILMTPLPDGTWTAALDREGKPVARTWRDLAREALPARRRSDPPPAPELRRRVDNLVPRVIQKESNGRNGLVSSDGALGLMQVMPDTGREVAQRLGLPFDEWRLRHDPEYNRRIGTRYLTELMQEFDGNEVLALAAYNAGPRRAREWLQRFGHPAEVGAERWVRSIPFPETKDYVATILGVRIQ